MTECIILQLCKTLLSSFSCTVQVSAFKESTQQNQKKKKKIEKGNKNNQGMEPYKKTLERLGTLQLEGDVMEIIGEKKSHGGCGS